MQSLTRVIHPEIRVLDTKEGLVEYVASDESVDSYGDVIRAKGWRFTHFKKNAPFVDSHDYSSIDKQLGCVVESKVAGGKLVQLVKWALEARDSNRLIDLGWKMTEGGFLKAVSVGFYPVKYVSRHGGDRAAWHQQLQELGMTEEQVRGNIFLEQEQIELSACIIGANPNALAKAYKAECLGDSDLELLSTEYAKRNATAWDRLGDDSATRALESLKRQQFADTITRLTQKI